MTIKKRIFISNILMYVVPIIITFIMSVIMFFVFIGITGNDSIKPWHSKVGDIYEQFDTLSQGWTNDTDIEMIKTDIEQQLTSSINGAQNRNFVTALIAFAFLIIIIFITSRLLTHFVFRSITASIDTLVFGVHQIRDGNLNYRIDYKGKDEFSEICSDFNEMAQRFSDFVDERLKSEENRKELIAGISHDLRTPLTAIKAYLEGIEKGVAKSPEAQKRYLDIIKVKTLELERIINQLFMFSKIDIGDFPFVMDSVNIYEILDQYTTLVSKEYEEKGLSIIYHNDNKAAHVSVDIQQLHNAITNVVENSLKYKTKEQGTLYITCCKNASDVIITLTDDGEGVSAEALSKLFHIFYRTDASRGKTDGSGIGLAITAKILERMGGSIKAENAIKGGLEIVITLPIINGGQI